MQLAWLLPHQIMPCKDRRANMKKYSRRLFLQQSITAAASFSPLLGILDALGQVEAAEINGRYKAIVCVLLEGGADVFNMIAPTNQSTYNDYRQVRGNIALPRNSLLGFAHANNNGNNPLAYGMRNNMTRMHQLFAANKLAIIANVGTLVEAVTAEDVLNGAPVPFELFAHNTQRAQWMFGNATGTVKEGWAGRASHAFYASGHPAAAYFNVNIADSNNILQMGGSAEAIHFSEAEISPNTMKTFGFGPMSGGGDLGSVYQALYEAKQNDTSRLMSALANKRIAELNRPIELANLFDNVENFNGFNSGVHEVGKSLGKQLELVAQILSVKDNFPGQPNRQIFFVNHHGWDTHDSDNEHQAGYLSDSLGAFQDAIDSMGLTSQITTFTISDFGRSLTSNGNGTDHGWGSHAFVMGGAVDGGDIYGSMPELRKDSPDAWFDRMVPTTSMEQYLASIVRWFGATEGELRSIFPNYSLFDSNGLGFMKA